tara:strand:+ start:123 stop:257 length:135 start_codon:yes stop_codon:yes gene_type:complete
VVVSPLLAAPGSINNVKYNKGSPIGSPIINRGSTIGSPIFIYGK